MNLGVEMVGSPRLWCCVVQEGRYLIASLQVKMLGNLYMYVEILSSSGKQKLSSPG